MPKKSKVKLVLCLNNNGQFLLSYHPLIRTLKKIKDATAKVKNKDIILAIPSSGIHSNGYSLVRTILKRNKISNKIKNEYQLFDTGLTKLAKISKNQILSVISYNIIF